MLVLGVGAYWILAKTSATRTATQYQSTNSADGAPEGSIHNLPVEPAAAAARIDLAQKLGLATNSVVIMFIEEKMWSDGCLGLGGPAESCMAALTDGFRVEMEARGSTYVYRTDRTGTQVRAETN